MSVKTGQAQSGAVQGSVAGAYRVGSARVLRLVSIPGARSACGEPGAYRTVSAVDAGSAQLPALNSVTAAVGNQRLLPHLRHRRRAGALARRVRPSSCGVLGVADTGADAPAVRGDAGRRTRVRPPG